MADRFQHRSITLIFSTGNLIKNSEDSGISNFSELSQQLRRRFRELSPENLVAPGQISGLIKYAFKYIIERGLLLRDFGSNLGRPAVDTLKGSKHANLKELRFAWKSGVWRVAFAFDPARQAVLLVGGDKKEWGCAGSTSG